MIDFSSEEFIDMAIDLLEIEGYIESVNHSQKQYKLTDKGKRTFQKLPPYRRKRE